MNREEIAEKILKLMVSAQKTYYENNYAAEWIMFPKMELNSLADYFISELEKTKAEERLEIVQNVIEITKGFNIKLMDGYDYCKQIEIKAKQQLKEATNDK